MMHLINEQLESGNCHQLFALKIHARPRTGESKCTKDDGSNHDSVSMCERLQQADLWEKDIEFIETKEWCHCGWFENVMLHFQFLEKSLTGLTHLPPFQSPHAPKVWANTHSEMVQARWWLQFSLHWENMQHEQEHGIAPKLHSASCLHLMHQHLTEFIVEPQNASFSVWNVAHTKWHIISVNIAHVVIGFLRWWEQQIPHAADATHNLNAQNFLRNCWFNDTKFIGHTLSHHSNKLHSSHNPDVPHTPRKPCTRLPTNDPTLIYIMWLSLSAV